MSTANRAFALPIHSKRAGLPDHLRAHQHRAPVRLDPAHCGGYEEVSVGAVLDEAERFLDESEPVRLQPHDLRIFRGRVCEWLNNCGWLPVRDATRRDFQQYALAE